MKKIFYVILSPLFLLLGCGSNSLIDISSTGSPYEVLVISEKPQWNGIVGDTLRSIMSEEVLWLNQPEPIFDILSITPEALNDITRRHRNLFIITIDSALDSTFMTISEDKWSTGQVILEVSSPSDSLAALYLSDHRATLTGFLSAIEQNRMHDRSSRYNESYIEKQISAKFDISMVIPMGYKIANDTTDFMWLIYDMPISSQGVVLYSFDKPSEGGEKLNFVSERNSAISLIPGPVSGSYMSTDVTFYPESRVVEINGVGWVETRGFWRVEGDFMGGPFINYVTLNSATNRYLGIDMYVYSPSPRYPKRNYIRQLESLMLGVEFPK